MTGSEVIAAIRAALQADLEKLVAVTSAALDEATNADNRAENKYDTRSLEASYLAGAQSERLLELKQLIAYYAQLEPGCSDTVQLGSLVELEEEDRTWWVFLAPRAGGRTVKVKGVPVTVLSSTSPLGRALLGCEEEDDVVFDTPRGSRELTVLQVAQPPHLR